MKRAAHSEPSSSAPGSHRVGPREEARVRAPAPGGEPRPGSGRDPGGGSRAPAGAALRAGRWALAVAGLLMVISGPAAGQQPRIDTPYRWIQPSLRLSVFGGHTAAQRGQSDIGPGPGPTAGARVRVRVSSPVSLEASALYGSSDRFVVDPRLESGPAPVDTVAADWVQLQAGVQLALTGARTWHGLQPYVVVGGGLMVGVNQEESTVFADTVPETVRYKINTLPAVHAGVGTEWFLSDTFTLGVELRDQLRRIKTPDAFFRQEVLDRIDDLGLPAPTETDWTHNLELTAGLWYYF